MNKMNLKILLLSLLFVLPLAAQQKNVPQTLSAFGLIPVQKPVLLDSTDLQDKKFTDETLLSFPVSFPAPERFITQIEPDELGYFHLSKPEKGYAFQLVSFFVKNDRYGKGKLKITSPDMFEVYIDGESKTSKKKFEPSYRTAEPVETALNGNVNNSRVVLKILTYSGSQSESALKIEIEADKSDSLVQFTFGESDKRRMTINDVLEGRRVSSSSVSPSGRYVLLRFSETFAGGESKRSIELYDTKLKKTLLSDAADRSQLSWMPKSDLLYYVSDEGKSRTMFTFDPATLTTKTVAENLPKESFHIAPDEKSMFYSTKKSLNVTEPKGLKRLLAPDDRQAYYRDKYYICRYFFDSGLSQQITYGCHTASLNDVSEDVTQLLFSVSEENLTERPFRKNSLFLLNLQTMQLDTIWKDERFANSARFSPDGKKLLISGAPEAFNKIGQNIASQEIANSYDSQAFIFDLDTKKIEAVTRNFDPAIDQQDWSRNNGFIYFRVQDRDYENVYRYDPARKSFEKLPLKEDVIRSFSIADNGEWATYTGVSASNSSRAYILNLKSLQSTLIADPYAERLSKLSLGEVEDWSFKSSYGDPIDGRFYLPPYFDPSKKYPLIVYYYGGTSPTQRVFESTYPLHVYAAQGYVVYTLQPSGTTGYGQEFSSRHVNAWGKQTADEIIEGTKKFVAEHPFVEASKIGCIGASYGGFMTQYLQTQTDLFAAAVSHAGISNIASYWGEGYWGYSYSSVASADSYPWNNPKLYMEQSPLFHADKIKTPLLLLHGTADTNVPIGESIQMYTALRLLGKTVEFVQVDGENHGIYDYAKRIAWNNTIYAWFAKWLKDDSQWWDSMYPNPRK
ncbi:MAG: S9 family peptidase [Dysgonamonadaceae bacterium]|jgi:dipeptidyl aminopeptidase/acylaminoacyl peptidase|nr:S9 family peptidase [Dysgonamonadaceae bacterium]